MVVSKVMELEGASFVVHDNTQCYFSTGKHLNIDHVGEFTVPSKNITECLERCIWQEDCRGAQMSRYSASPNCWLLPDVGDVSRACKRTHSKNVYAVVEKPSRRCPSHSLWLHTVFVEMPSGSRRAHEYCSTLRANADHDCVARINVLTVQARVPVICSLNVLQRQKVKV